LEKFWFLPDRPKNFRHSRSRALQFFAEIGSALKNFVINHWLKPMA
jgi:hypothetical protein